MRYLETGAEPETVFTEERWRDAKSDWYCREACFAELRGDRIARLSVYCTGDGDREWQAAHAGQVVLLEP